MIEINSKYLSKQRKADNMRWFTDTSHDLFLWCNGSNEIIRFQFCYGKNSGNEHLVEWERNLGIKEFTVDDGETGGVSKSTPILKNQTVIQIEKTKSALMIISKYIDKPIYEFIINRLSINEN